MIRLEDDVAMNSAEQAALLLVESGADPWVTLRDGLYHYCRVVDDWQISISVTPRLEDIGNPELARTVWEHPLKSNQAELWAPELHYLDDRWYMYGSYGNGTQHRLHVWTAQTKDPQGDYQMEPIHGLPEGWAIDATIFEHSTGRYLLWSGVESPANPQQNLYIAKMKSPSEVEGEPVCIARPTLSWERSPEEGLPPVNEGPRMLTLNGRHYLTFSAAHSLTDNYCIGVTELIGDDPLDPEAWIKHPAPVFKGTDGVYGTGRACFVEMPDGSLANVHHRAWYSGAGWNRFVCVQLLKRDQNGWPIFGEPLSVEARRNAAHDVADLALAAS